MNKPKLSFVVAIYNIQEFLPGCLKSLISQTEKEVEFVLVDDGSTDLSSKIADDFAKADARIRVIHSKCNMGSLNARLVGIRESLGDWICFVDGDDCLGYPDAAKDLINLMQKYDADILRFSAEARKLDGTLGNFWRGDYLGSIDGSLRINRACFVNYQYSWEIWGKCYRASLLKSILPKIKNERLSAAEDVYLYFIITTVAKTFVSIHSRAIYIYIVGSGITSANICADKFINNFAKEPIICKWIQDYLQNTEYGADFNDSLEQLLHHLTDNQINRLSYIDINDWPKCICALSNNVCSELIFECLNRRMRLREGKINIDQAWILDSMREQNLSHAPFNRLLERVSRIKNGFIRKKIRKILLRWSH